MLNKEDILSEQALISSVEQATAGKVQIRKTYIEAEKRVHAMAFQAYYDMGDSRSLAKVAKHMHMTEQTIQKWSSRFKWITRVRELDALALDKTNAHSQIEIDKVKKAIADCLGEELKGMVEYGDDGKIAVKGPKVRTLKDVKDALDVYYRVTGELAKEDAMKKVTDPSNGVNIQFVIKGR